MAIKKQFLKKKPVCKVTFSVPAEDAEKVSVIGDFNDWDPEKHLLKKQKDGTFKASFEFPKERSYEFKYLIDGNYANEPEADRFQWNDYAGTENAVLEL